MSVDAAVLTMPEAPVVPQTEEYAPFVPQGGFPEAQETGYEIFGGWAPGASETYGHTPWLETRGVETPFDVKSSGLSPESIALVTMHFSEKELVDGAASKPQLLEVVDIL